MNTRRFKIAVVTGVATLILAASTAFAETPGRDKDNSPHLTNSIRKQLVTLPFYGVFDNLEFKLEGETVTLYGQTLKPITRKDAERRVRKLEGVERVVNNIEVLPLSRFDDSIRLRTYRAIFRSAGLHRYALGANPSLHIIVNRGHVTLEGVVSNKFDSRLAYIAASQVPGVFSVVNNLRVENEN